MKSFALLWAAFILILALNPGISVLSIKANTESSCCGEVCNPESKKINTQEENKDNGCEGKSCNPFQVCGCCILVCPNLPSNNLEKVAAVTEKVFTYQSDFSNPLTSDFWQQPRTV